MRTGMVISILITLIFLGIIGYLFYIGELDFNFKKTEYSNVSISAKLDRKNIKTGYVIESNQGIKRGKTSQTYEVESIQKDQIIKVYNENLEGQTYFKNIQEVNISRGNHRVDIKLEEPSKIEVNFKSLEPISLELYSKDARDINLCLTWSLNYIFVKPENLDEIEKPKIYERWDKCYFLNESLKDSKLNLTINYQRFGIINENDYINMSLIQNQFIGQKDQIINLI